MRVQPSSLELRYEWPMHDDAPPGSCRSVSQPADEARPSAVFVGSGEMAQRCRSTDWSATALGPVTAWPQSLRTAVQIALAAPFPSVVLWGPDGLQIYNDAALALQSLGHPTLGRPARESPLAPWRVNDALLLRVKNGESVACPGVRCSVERAGAPEDVLLSLFYSPLRDEAGAVSGVLVTAFDSVKRPHPAPRASGDRDAFLLALGDRLRARATPSDIHAEACRMLGEWLHVDRATYASLQNGVLVVHRGHASGVAPLPPGPLPLTAAGGTILDALQRGETVAVDDVSSDAQLTAGERDALRASTIGAFVVRPIVEAGRLGAALMVADSRPRKWSEEDLSLVEQASERTWLALERVRAEATLQDGETRQTFLTELGNTLRWLGDPAQIHAAVSRLVAERFATSRAYYIEFHADEGIGVVHWDHVRGGAPSRVGVTRLDDFRPVADILCAGKAFVLNDSLDCPELPKEVGERYAALAERAQVTVPLLRGGKLVGAFTMSQATPREWTPFEISLLREAADRTWVAIERVSAEDGLRNSERRLKKALSIVTIGVMFFRLDGRVLDANDAFTRMCGYGLDELRTMRHWEVLTPSGFRDATAHAMRELAAQGETAPYEKQLVRKDGSRFWGLFAPTRLSGSGPDSECVEFILDISEQRRLHQQREDLLLAVTAAHTDAKLANKAKDEFLTTLGHELRTPLAAILLWAGALRSGAVSTTELDRALEAIVQSAESQSRLVDDLLDLSRLTSGNLSLAPRAVVVENVARAAVDVIQRTALEKGVKLEVDVPESLGAARLDPARLKQVLWNLLSNAVKFTPRGGSVTLHLRKQGGSLLAEVADTGEGIAVEFMPHVFERFRQADMGETRQHAGLGIGLAISRQLVELQGGTIEAHSEGPGRGAVFRVRLPWREPDLASPKEGATAPATMSRSALRGVTVLLVEDDAATREAMLWALTRAGAAVVPVGSGAEALSVLDAVERGERQRDAPDVMVCDLGLPGMSGDELIRRVVERRRARGERLLPACAVSAHARDVDRQRAVQSGFDLYLAKPVAPERLIEAVADLRDVSRSPEA